ncbi:pyridoxamine 5'-phosphate oxidase [Pseudovibrio sp. Tun.PSC04-5.I4]|uniref:pyridoxamine 5'-phosphate oxidase n=1 Tax=Pseudovibrio sp. Tun.PSC04-5.I4 TaxID=1798213 RepID=UPI001FCB6C4A|nr:pyridoxamine 5'-phosphate oxidase [Pseudovibrio sp. Tun.PSC04-5.I4]
MEEKFTNSYSENIEVPFQLFGEWLALAEKNEPNDPNAMSVATVDDDGMPNVRMLLLKGYSPQGFVFYTNFESTKGQEILNHPKVALCFHWKSLRRQVRVRGNIIRVTEDQADEYYTSRPRKSRIGAWASKQSRPLESRFALEKEVARYAAKYAIGDIPRPDYWSGCVLQPTEIEFWHDRAFRLHDRFVFKRESPTDDWGKVRLYP